MIANRRSAICLIGGGLLTAATRAAPSGPRRDLYKCDGCQAVDERSPVGLPSRLRLAPPSERGEAMLLSGRVLDRDGRPAPGVVIYAHHTDARGLYSRGSDESQWSRRHGLLRGWVKTDRMGHYAFATIKPAPYPNRSMPAHVHLFIQEPGRQPYYVDDVVFAGEVGVDRRYVSAQELRGGSGIVPLTRAEGGTWLARRDILLERHP